MNRMGAAALVALALSACAAQGPAPGTAPLTLTPVGFDALPGWQQEHQAGALAAFQAGCAGLALLAPDQKLGGAGEAARLGGQAGQWSAVCAAAGAVPPGDDAAARRFFEADFTAYAVGEAGRTDALFTGYYEPEVRGARGPGEGYDVPLLGRPADLVQLDLDDFFPDLKGRRTAGRVTAGRLVPYYDRAQIENGALADQHLGLLWLADPVDLFFLQVQGAGRVRLPDGRVVRVGYAAQNGRPYVPIGRLLVERGQLKADEVSEQSIRAWLAAHPADAQALMDENPSYVFFRELPGLSPDEGPPGALGVPLTPERSMAVDRAFLPLGAPVWVDTADPLDGSRLQRLVMAQDLGAAIRGPLRGDLFFGWGAAAAARAGRMDQHGRDYLLLPRAP
jgi:membrane-bound lytic murein transglycosylase A